MMSALLLSYVPPPPPLQSRRVSVHGTDEATKALGDLIPQDPHDELLAEYSRGYRIILCLIRTNTAVASALQVKLDSIRLIRHAD